jgi:L-ascorbate metabolism protein UlaG (beta-lactamase superfamily)
MQVTWLGHASFLIHAAGKAIYIDPYVGEYTKTANLILVSHRHADHCALDKIQLIRGPDTQIITSQDCASVIPGDVLTLQPGNVWETNGLVVEAVEAYNFTRFRSPGVPYHPRGTQIGFIVTADSARVYHVGDTDLIPEMQAIHDIDILLLPIMGRATMDLAEAVRSALVIQPRIAIPMHWRDVDPQPFKEQVEAQSDVQVLVLADGDIITP